MLQGWQGFRAGIPDIRSLSFWVVVFTTSSPKLQGLKSWVASSGFEYASGLCVWDSVQSHGFACVHKRDTLDPKLPHTRLVPLANRGGLDEAAQRLR